VRQRRERDSRAALALRKAEQRRRIRRRRFETNRPFKACKRFEVAGIVSPSKGSRVNAIKIVTKY
jgi:hypothetical protein